MAALASTQTPINSSLHALSLGSDKYKGATVEDLQLPPAFSLPLSEPISRAIELAYERDFSHIPYVAFAISKYRLLRQNVSVLDRHRRPVGYVDVAKLKEKWEADEADPNDKVSHYMTKFLRTVSQPYTVITPFTPLSDLEDFLQTHLFALVTDANRKFVLAVATQEDLNSFVSRRGI
ncbi:hypothetical protein C0995_009660 [Termitomyces sp. Mi166|nr:hypothetical protein C0995_009660 [Termitomyces sp. Mi166\